MIGMKKGGFYLQPRTISRFWLRRLCEVSFLGCLTILALYAWARFIPTGYQLPIGLAVADIAAAAAAVGSLVTLILCLWLPRNHESTLALAVYFLTVAVIVTTIATSGGIHSPFTAIWVVAAIFAGFFGGMALGLLAALVVAQAALSVAQDGFNASLLLGQLFIGLLPLLFSMVLWNRHQPRREKAALSDLQHKLSTIEGKSDVVINTIDDGVLAISREGTIELINPSAQALIGWHQGDALGLSWKSVLKLVGPDGRDVGETDHPIAQALATNKPTHSDKLFLLTSSEKRRLVSIVSSPVGNDGEGIIVVFRDITKEKAEEREQAEFISTASHEMRTPVASIEGYLGLALNPATANIDEKARDFITKAHASAQHLGRLFQDLLDISKIEDGRLNDNPEVVKVGDFVKNIFDGLKPKADEKQLNYIYRPDMLNDTGGEHFLQPIFYAYVDADHLREIVDNLIENAIKYTASGEVIIDVIGDDKRISISVKDSGVGIPAEDIPHLFQKFYRVDNSDTREIGGTGLGLYLSRRLAENMSGTLRVESEYKKGSTFFLEIPRLSNDEASRKLEEAAAKAKTAADEVPVATPAPELEPMPYETPAAEIEPIPQPEPTPVVTPEPETVTPPEPVVETAQPVQTLADIEKQLGNQRAQLSIPDRK